MKYLCIIILFPCFSFAQLNPNVEKLRTFSYPVFGINLLPKDTVYRTWGTGFFLRKKGELFFVTAKHVLTGCENAIQNDHYPDYMNIYIEKNKRVISLNVKSIRDSCPCLAARDDTDMIVIKIEDTLGKYVNSVESYIRKPFKKIDDIEILGKPFSNDMMLFAKPREIKMPKNGYSIYNSQYTDTTMSKLDFSLYLIYPSTFKVDKSLRGFSGSPVFIRKENSNKYRIAGLLSAYTLSKGNDYLSAVKIDYILESVNRIILNEQK